MFLPKRFVISGISGIAIVIIAGLFFYFFGFKNQEEEPTTSTYKAGVVSNGYECATIGRSMFKKGGSAIDAAIATLFCEGIAQPQSMGLGGGFVMTIYDRSNGKVETLNAREIAPKNAHRDMFHGNATLSQIGGLAVAVPGELRGYWTVHQKYGNLPWSDLIEPSIQLCEKGILVTDFLARLFHKYLDRIEGSPSLREVFIDPNTSEPYVKGQRIKRLQLAKTLRIVAEHGADALYNGELTKKFVGDIQDMGGIIQEDDMHDYQPRWGNPLSAKLPEGNTLYTLEPPASGVILIFILNLLQNLLDFTSYDSIKNIHLTIESFKYAYARRSQLGDLNFIDIKRLMNDMISPEYAKGIAEKISDKETFQDPLHYGAKFLQPEDHGTAHVSVIGPNGDAVSVTSTINLVFGARFISPSTGIVLNSEMDDFASPNITNDYGIPPSVANFIEPGKIPLSSMCPSIILNKNGDPVLVIGAAGGTKITTTVAQIVARNLWFNQPIAKAIASLRFHHQVIPMEVKVEENFNKTIIEGLEKIGHKVVTIFDHEQAGFAASTALARRENTLEGSTDPRRSGTVYLFN